MIFGLMISGAIQRMDPENQTKNEIVNILNKQATREERMSIADEVILNNGSIEHLRNSVLDTHKKYMEIIKNE